MINGIDYYRQYEPVFGEWKLEKLLGEGSSGEVFSISRTRADGKVEYEALKAITVPKSDVEFKILRNDGFTPESAQSYLRDVCASIVREYSIMAQFNNNPNIVGYRDHLAFKHSNGIGWDILIRMELLTPVVDYFRETRLTIREILKLGIHICKALEVCHNANIIHRDIKPENIFIDEKGNYKLGDFGIARELEKSSAGLTKTGTLTYMAPEIYTGKAYGKSIDIYSLGIVLYKLVNHNRIPFSPRYPEPITYDSRDAAIMARMSGEKIPYPDGTNFREFSDIILKACSYSPEDRFQSATEMRTALESLLRSEAFSKFHEGIGVQKEERAVLSKSVCEIVGSDTSGIRHEDKSKKAARQYPDYVRETPKMVRRVRQPEKESVPLQRKNSLLDNKLATALAVFIPMLVIIIAVVAFFLARAEGKKSYSPVVASSTVFHQDNTPPNDTEETDYGTLIHSSVIDNVQFEIYSSDSDGYTLYASGNGYSNIPDREAHNTISFGNISRSDITKVVVRNVKKIGNNAFYDMSSLKTVEIQNVSIIGECAFDSCKILNSVTMENAGEIHTNAFRRCIALETLKFPQSVTKIYNCTDDCTNLSEIYIYNANAEVIIAGNYSADYKLFHNCSDTLTIYLPKNNSDGSTTKIYNTLTNKGYNLEEIQESDSK